MHFQQNVNSTERKIKIAIIGGGPAAISVLTHLVKALHQQNFAESTEIFIFEKNDKLGVGLPYAYEEDHYIVNLPKHLMESPAQECISFTQWLQQSIHRQNITDFPPRYYFGEYLKDIAHKLRQEEETNGVLIKYHTQCEVTDIQHAAEDRYLIVTSKGQYHCDYAILCTGHLPTSTYRHFIGQKGYFHDPWDREIYQPIARDEDVVIIGTRLTAIDCVLKLVSQEHQGNISLVSRSGLLPAVLAKEIPSYTLRHLTIENLNHLTHNGRSTLSLEKLLQLFWKELSESENKTLTYEIIPKSIVDISPLDWLDKEILSAESNHKPWQQVLFALYSLTPFIWNLLSLSDKQQFLAQYQSLFLTYLTAFPLENAYQIRQLLKRGQLDIYGGLTHIAKQGKKYISFLPNKNLSSTYLFNCTGPGYDASLVPLFQRMIHHKIIQPHTLGGIEINFENFRTKNSKNLYAIGELTRNAHYATADYKQVTIKSEIVASSVMRTICGTRIHERY
ncbi:MAG: FAD/NAD(P)-binding protein [Gammaproteobacteria bacterium]